MGSGNAPVRMPDVIRPMLASPATEPFDSNDHIFELMWGGARATAFVRDGQVHLRGRNNCDLTACLPELGIIPDLVKAHEAILDGEVVAIDGQGQPSFDALRPRLHTLLDDDIDTPPAELVKPRKLTGQLCFQAFDLLWHDGRSLMDRPLWQRKNRLHEIIKPTTEFAAVDFVDDEGLAFYEAVLQRRLEGVVAKRKISAYTPGRTSTDWMDVRALQSGDFVIGGYTFGGARRRGEPFGQLLLGAFDDGRFEYIGAVSGGMSDAEAKQIVAMLEPTVVERPEFMDPPPMQRLIYWTRPEHVCHVRFSEWSRDGYLRFPIFSSMRPDIDAEECVLA
jgi:DNA ligase D-like protein (predicted ligase)